jgi:hypothetical protein
MAELLKIEISSNGKNTSELFDIYEFFQIQINYGLLCVLVYFYPCLMTGGIIRYNFESRHYNDDSDKPCFIVCVGVLLPMFDDWWDHQI